MTPEQLKTEFESVVGSGLDQSKWRRLSNGAWLHNTAMVKDESRVGEGASVGEGARVGEGASVGAWASVGASTDCMTIGPVGSRNAILTLVKYDGKVMVGTGCFWGDIDAFEKSVLDKHGDTKHGKNYAAAIALARVWAAVPKKAKPTKKPRVKAGKRGKK